MHHLDAGAGITRNNRLITPQVPPVAAILPAAHEAERIRTVKGMLLGRQYGDGAKAPSRNRKSRPKPVLTIVLVVIAAVGLSYGAYKVFGTSADAADDNAGVIPSGHQEPAVIRTPTVDTPIRPATPTRTPAPVLAPTPTAPVTPVAATTVASSGGTSAAGTITAAPATTATATAATTTISPVPVSAPAATTDAAANQEAAILMAEADRHQREGRLLEARATYASALAKASGYEQQTDIAVKLASVSERTLLGPRVYPGDDLVEEYVVKADRKSVV